jgi:adenine C2-methylase RlmN of 23S rRNA A2503 and tRNA A37
MRILSISVVSLLATLHQSYAFSVAQSIKGLQGPTVSKTALFMADEARKQVKEYKSAMSAIRTDPNGGPKPIDVVMKFGGSSLANYERIDHVAQLIKDQIKAGYRPRAIVCSAMGKTTNNLLSAGDFALGE